MTTWMAVTSPIEMSMTLQGGESSPGYTSAQFRIAVSSTSSGSGYITETTFAANVKTVGEDVTPYASRVTVDNSSGGMN